MGLYLDKCLYLKMTAFLYLKYIKKNKSYKDLYIDKKSVTIII